MSPGESVHTLWNAAIRRTPGQVLGTLSSFTGPQPRLWRSRGDAGTEPSEGVWAQLESGEEQSGEKRILPVVR